MTEGVGETVSQTGRAFLRIHPVAGAFVILSTVAVGSFGIGGLVSLFLMRNLPAQVDVLEQRVGALEDWRDGQMGEIIGNFSELRCILRAERQGLDVDVECPLPERVIPPRPPPPVERPEDR